MHETTNMAGFSRSRQTVSPRLPVFCKRAMGNAESSIGRTCICHGMRTEAKRSPIVPSEQVQKYASIEPKWVQTEAYPVNAYATGRTSSSSSNGCLSERRHGACANVFGFGSTSYNSEAQWRKKSKAEVRKFRRELWMACSNLQLKLPEVREMVVARLCASAFLLPEIHFDLEEAQVIVKGEKRDTARAVRECRLLLSSTELALQQRIETYEMAGRQMTFAEATEAAAESAAASARLAATLTGCCVLAGDAGPSAGCMLMSSTPPTHMAGAVCER